MGTQQQEQPMALPQKRRTSECRTWRQLLSIQHFSLLCFLIVSSLHVVDAMDKKDAGNPCPPSNLRYRRLHPGAGLVILGLFDLHRPGPRPTTCGGLSTPTVQALESLTWAVTKLNEAAFIPGLTLGFSAYDVCGQEELVRDAVMDFIAKEKEDCKNSIIIGMLVTSSQSSTLAGQSWFDTLDIPYFTITDEKLTSFVDFNHHGLNAIRVSPSAETYTEAVIEFLHRFNLTYISVIHDEDHQGFWKAFNRMAPKSGICIANAISIERTEPVSISTLPQRLRQFPGAETVVTFLRPEKMIEFIKELDQRGNILPIFASSLDIRTEIEKGPIRSSASFLMIQPTLIQNSDFASWLLNVSSHGEILDEFQREFFMEVFQCTFTTDIFSAHRSCNILLSKNMDESFTQDSQVDYVARAVMALASVVKYLNHVYCSTSNKGQCTGIVNLEPKELVDVLRHSSYPTRPPLPVGDPGANILSLKRQEFESDIAIISSKSRGTIRETLQIGKFNELGLHLDAHQVFPWLGKQISCGRLCLTCSARMPSELQTESDQIIDMQVRLLKKSVEGSTCSIKDAYQIGGIRFAIKTLQQRYRDLHLFPRLSLGMSISDNFLSEVYPLISDYDAVPDRLAATLLLSEKLTELEDIQGNRGHPVIFMGRHFYLKGLHESTHTHDNALNVHMDKALLELFTGIDLKYMIVIYSTSWEKYVKNLDETFYREGLCFAALVEFKDCYKPQKLTGVSTAGCRTFRRELSGVLRHYNVSVVLLLLNDEEFKPFAINTDAIIQQDITWILPLFDLYFVDTVKQSARGKVVTFETQALPNPSYESHFKIMLSNSQDESDPFWEAVHAACELKTSQTVDDRTKSFTAVMINVVDTIISTLDQVYRQLCPDVVGPCANWIVHQNVTNLLKEFLNNRVEESKRRVYLHSDGTLAIPADVIIYYKSEGYSKEEKIGSLSADSTFHRSLPFPKIATDSLSKSCGNWCPQCKRCSPGREPFTPFSLYPGDLNLVLLMPVHAAGINHFTCGGIRYQEGEHQILEAFIHAVETVHRRRPMSSLMKHINIGGLVLDTCSQTEMMAQHMLNVEGCQITYTKNHHKVLDETVMAYIIPRSMEFQGDYSTLQTSKPIVTPNAEALAAKHARNVVAVKPYFVQQAVVITDLLVALNWTYVFVVTSNTTTDREATDAFLAQTRSTCLCVGSIHVIPSVDATNHLVSELRRRNKKVGVVFSDEASAIEMFHSISRRLHDSLWILVGSNFQTVYHSDIQDGLLGTLAVVPQTDPDWDFHQYYAALRPSTNTRNPWFKELWEAQFMCSFDHSQFNKKCRETDNFSHTHHPLVPWMFGVVDTIVETLQGVYNKACPGWDDHAIGLCKKWDGHYLDQFTEALQNLSSVKQDNEQPSFVIKNFQLKPGHVYEYSKVGRHENEMLTLTLESMLFYGPRGHPMASMPSVQCAGCSCVNITSGNVIDLQSVDAELSTPNEHIWIPVAYVNATWVTAALTMSVIGILICITLMVYIIYKKFTKVVTYGISMGILLLVGLCILYASTLPFALTPSELTCGLRLFMVGLAYTFCFAVILVKSMTLRYIKYMGLGGEVSWANQWLTFFFIVAAQAGMAAQFWSLKSPLVVALPPGEWQSDSIGFVHAHGTILTCSYNKNDFASTLIFPLCLLALTTMFTSSVRKIKHNCNEVTFLLVACWLCIPACTTWLCVFLLVPGTHHELTLCAGMLVCATLILVSIYLPQVHVLSTMKYHISGMAFDTMRQRNSYRSHVGTDFVFCEPGGVNQSSKCSSESNPVHGLGGELTMPLSTRGERATRNGKKVKNTSYRF